MKNASIVILVIMVIGLGGFITYDKVLKNDKPEENKVSDNKKNEEDKEDIYQKYLDNLENNISLKLATFNIDLTNNKQRNIYLNLDGTLYLEYVDDMDIESDKITDIPSLNKGENSVKGIKLNISNIVDIFFIEGISVSAIETLYALDNKGNIYFIASSFDWNDSKITSHNFEPIKIEELKNIVSISNYRTSDGLGGWTDAEAIDIDGNKFNLVEYTDKYHIYDSAF